MRDGELISVLKVTYKKKRDWIRAPRPPRREARARGRAPGPGGIFVRLRRARESSGSARTAEVADPDVRAAAIQAVRLHAHQPPHARDTTRRH